MKLEKPFVKLLKSPNAGYFFDVNRNEIIAVSDEAYEFLEREQAGAECEATEEVFAELEALREVGYLSGNKVKEIRHPLTDYIEDIVCRNMQKLTLQLTQDCNFRCTYCPYTPDDGNNRSHKKKKMSLETAKKAIKFLHNNSVDSNLVYIGFYGGEPLLEYNMIRELVNYANIMFLGRKLRYTITTNLSLLKDEMVEFFIKHDFDIIISLDGIKEIHDKNRKFAKNDKGTYDSIIKKLEHLYNVYNNFYKKILINMVIDPSNDFDKINSLFYSNEIFKESRFQSSLIDDTYSLEKNVFSKEYVSKANYHTFLSYLEIFNRIDSAMLSPIVKNATNRLLDDIDKMMPIIKLQSTCAPGGPCVPGEVRPMVTVDGDLFPCERVSETSEAMKIGDIYSGFDMDKVCALLNIGLLTPKECRNCWAFLRCNICARCADDNGELSANKKLEFCANCKETILSRFKEMIMLREAKQIYNV